LEIAELNRKTYYYYLKRLKKSDKYATAKVKITEIFEANKGRYGYRRITDELLKTGIKLNHKTVERLMKVLGLKCLVRMKKYRSYKGEVGKIAPNLLNRDFEASRPNEKWTTDVTEFSLFGQKLYLSPILDLYDRSIIAYTIYEHPGLKMVTEMVKTALKKEEIKEPLILHSDQGWQYQHRQYQRLLNENGITQSMSRKGNCLDNAVIENFFGILKTELLYTQKFTSIEHFKAELIDYIDWYNNRRIKSKLGNISPLEYRNRAA
jgi:transposase InsO family protein